MAQPIRKKVIPVKKNKTEIKTVAECVKKRAHPKYGTSKLEDYFARNFLDVIGLKYEKQFEAKDIGRFYDFYVNDANVLIEVDGDFYHSYGLTYEEKSPMQKKNERIDRLKDEWARNNGYGLIRIWEHDIHNDPDSVMNLIKEKLGEYSEKQRKIKNKNKRH